MLHLLLFTDLFVISSTYMYLFILSSTYHFNHNSSIHSYRQDVFINIITIIMTLHVHVHVHVHVCVFMVMFLFISRIKGVKMTVKEFANNLDYLLKVCVSYHSPSTQPSIIIQASVIIFIKPLVIHLFITCSCKKIFLQIQSIHSFFHSFIHHIFLSKFISDVPI